MKSVKFSFNYNKSKFSFDAEMCPRPEWGLGLMFKSRNTSPLLFDFGKPVSLALTSLFVFFPFVAVWLDHKNNVLAVEKIRPFRPVISSPARFSKLLEIPINGKNQREIALLVGDKKI